MILLGLDTSLGACSAALYDTGSQRVLASDFTVMERGHAEALGPMVQSVMNAAGKKPADLGRIVVTRGPGTFTGLRIGLAFAKGLALARGIPLLGIDSLWATAAAHSGGQRPVVVAHKAGATGKFYVGCFDGAHAKPLRPLALLSAHALQMLMAEFDKPMLLGSGLQDQADVWPDANLFLPLAAALPDDPISGEPLYLRTPDAKPMALQGKTAPALRLARAVDADALSEIHGKCFPAAWTPEMLRVTCSSPSATTLIAENRGMACGFIQAQAAADEAEILTLCVLPELRRHGIAMLLLGGLVTDLKIRGMKTLFLEVADSNIAARGLYAQAGFRETGRRKAYYASGDDAITMALAL
mgnify:CR=1 FL=1